MITRTSIDLSVSIEELNTLHWRLKRQPKTDLELLEEIKLLLDTFQYVHKPQPIEIAFGLVVNDPEYRSSYIEYYNLNLKKFHATREGKFENAAKYRDEARKEIDKATCRLLKKRFNSTGPFYLFEGRVLYYDLDSRVSNLL